MAKVNAYRIEIIKGTALLEELVGVATEESIYPLATEALHKIEANRKMQGLPITGLQAVISMRIAVIDIKEIS